ncbi:MAG: hypothetical protein FWG67_08045 [Defluviitaleaceae bacterium]|nr:hypothetical protein [Defluviitaleaceae bacterium]
MIKKVKRVAVAVLTTGALFSGLMIPVEANNVPECFHNGVRACDLSRSGNTGVVTTFWSSSTQLRVQGSMFTFSGARVSDIDSGYVTSTMVSRNMANFIVQRRIFGTHTGRINQNATFFGATRLDRP